MSWKFIILNQFRANITIIIFKSNTKKLTYYIKFCQVFRYEYKNRIYRLLVEILTALVSLDKKFILSIMVICHVDNFKSSKKQVVGRYGNWIAIWCVSLFRNSFGVTYEFIKLTDVSRTSRKGVKSEVPDL